MHVGTLIECTFGRELNDLRALEMPLNKTKMTRFIG